MYISYICIDMYIYIHIHIHTCISGGLAPIWIDLIAASHGGFPCPAQSKPQGMNLRAATQPVMEEPWGFYLEDRGT